MVSSLVPEVKILTKALLTLLMQSFVKRESKHSRITNRQLKNQGFPSSFFPKTASTSRRLEEPTKILECVAQGGHTTLTVFYNVDRSDVGEQKGSFAEALENHGKAYGKESKELLKWRNALTEAAKIPGWELQNGDEAQVVINKIITWILKECNVGSSSNTDAPVGNANEYLSYNPGSGGTNLGEKCYNMGPNHEEMQIVKEGNAASSSNMDAPDGNAKESTSYYLGSGGTNYGIMTGEKCFNTGPIHGNVQF